jgi:hypothetical protein
MTANRFDKLHELADEQHKAELDLANNGRTEAMNAYKKKPGRDTKGDLDAARDFYEETIDRFWGVYFPDDGPAQEGERFKNKKAALTWIVANHGNIVSQGKFFQDCGNGNPLVFPDKTVSKFSVLEYVLKLKSKNGSASVNPADADLAVRKEKAETLKAENDNRIAQVKADEAERERDAKWMLREDHEDAMAAFAGLCEDIFRHRVYLDHQALRSAAGGIPAKDAEFSYELQEFCNRAFNDVANYKEIDVEFEEEDGES